MKLLTHERLDGPLIWAYACSRVGPTVLAETSKGATLEGLVFEPPMSTDLLRAAGIQIEGLHVVEGGACSPVWLQLKADV